MTGGHKGHTSLDKIVSYATLNYIALKDFCAAYYLSSPPCIYLPSIPPPPPRSLSPVHPPPNLSPTLLTHPDGSQFASQQPCLPPSTACAERQHVQTKRYTRETHKPFLILNMDVIVLCLLKYFASPTRCSSCFQIACYYFEVMKLLVRCEMCVCVRYFIIAWNKTRTFQRGQQVHNGSSRVLIGWKPKSLLPFVYRPAQTPYIFFFSVVRGA